MTPRGAGPGTLSSRTLHSTLCKAFRAQPPPGPWARGHRRSQGRWLWALLNHGTSFLLRVETSALAAQKLPPWPGEAGQGLQPGLPGVCGRQEVPQSKREQGWNALSPRAAPWRPRRFREQKRPPWPWGPQVNTQHGEGSPQSQTKEALSGGFPQAFLITGSYFCPAAESGSCTWREE